VGASVIAVRRAGATFAFSALNFFFFIQQMISPDQFTGTWRWAGNPAR
jgi:hypothetical protein